MGIGDIFQKLQFSMFFYFMVSQNCKFAMFNSFPKFRPTAVPKIKLSPTL